MDKEIIKEELKEWFENVLSCTKEEIAFYEQFTGYDQAIALGFYAGFRAAERLAKIEVLKEVLNLYESPVSDGKTLLNIIDSLLSELKAGQ